MSNRGVKRTFEISKGNILCFLDADDYFKINKLKEYKQIFC